jgi:hypothetical protein
VIKKILGATLRSPHLSVQNLSFQNEELKILKNGLKIFGSGLSWFNSFIKSLSLVVAS